MDDQTKRAVLAVLRRSTSGLADVEARGCTTCGLSWLARLANRLMVAFGGREPFVDPFNYSRVAVRPLAAVADAGLIDRAMRELAEPPVCRHCGGTTLADDPADYHRDAVRHDGAPLLCLGVCRDREEAARRKRYAPG